MNPLDILKESRCYTCRHRLSRVIEPITQEDKEYWLGVLGIEDSEGYELYIEHHKCLLTDEDIDGIIKECNMHEPILKNQLIREYKF